MRHIKDPYVKQAKLQKYRSRSAFKLIEIDNQYQLLKPGMTVVDVGAAPGGWSQIIADRVGSTDARPTVIAVDLLEMAKLEGVSTVQGNINEEATQEKVSERMQYEKADLVCSDAVPDFIGDRFVDHVRSSVLNKEIVTFCSVALRPGGTLLMKIIQGPGEKELTELCTMWFKHV